MLKETETMTTLELDQENVDAFTTELRGELITPADPDYEQTRTIYNAMINKEPGFIARCESVADVVTAVNFAREQDLELAIHGGGHNGAGLALVDDGLV